MKKDKDQYKDDLPDTQTTIADMNVEGMPWYDPGRKGEGQASEIPQLSKRERRAMIKGMLLASLPLIGCMILAIALVYGLAYLWLS